MKQQSILTKIRGASALAYGLVVGLIAVVSLAAVTNIGAEVDSLFTTVGGEMDDVVQGTVGTPAPSASASASPSASPSPSAAILMVNGTYGIYPFVEDTSRTVVHTESTMNSLCQTAGFARAVRSCGTGGSGTAQNEDGFDCGGFPSYRTDFTAKSGYVDFAIVGRRYDSHGAAPAECGVQVVNNGATQQWCTCNNYNAGVAEHCSGNNGWTERSNQQLPVFVICTN